MAIAQTYSGQFILLCWTIILIYWIVRAPSVKRNIEIRAVWWWHIPPFAMLALIVVLLMTGGPFSEYIDAILWPSAKKNGMAGAVADIICLTGIIITLWARTTLAGNWNTGVTFKENHELITNGPYTFVRHPIYSGLLLMIFSVATWYGRISGFVFFASFVIACWLKLIQEEKLMIQHFPNEYPEYMKNVKALIPFLL